MTTITEIIEENATAGKPEPDGKNEYRQVKETYFAACPGYDADATKE